MKKSVVIVFSVSLLLLFSLSFVSANWFIDLFKGDVQLSPQDCSNGCKIIERQKIVVEGNYEIYVSSIRFNVRSRDFGATLRIRHLDTKASNNFDVVSGQKLDVIRDAKFVVDEIYQGAGKDYVAITYDFDSGGVQTCEDSDGGKDISVRGDTCVGDNCKSDYCFDFGEGSPYNLEEYYCQSDIDRGDDNYNCPNGCVDGACVKEESNNKEIKEGTFKEINGLWVYLESADETDLKLSVDLIVGKKIHLDNTRSSTSYEDFVKIDDIEYRIELVSASKDSATIKVIKKGDEEDVKAENIFVGNSGDDRLLIRFTDHRNLEKEFQWARGYSNLTSLQGDLDGRRIIVREGEKIYRNEYVVVGNEDNGHLLKLSQVTNQTTGHSNDKVTFTDIFSGDTYETTITADGYGTVSIERKVYVVRYGGTSSSDANWVRLNYPDSLNGDEMVIYPTIQTSLGAKIAFYEPLNVSINDWDGQGNTLDYINFPDGDGYIKMYTASIGTVDVKVGELKYRIIRSDGKFGVYLIDPRVKGSVYPEGRDVISVPSIIIFEEKDNEAKYNSIIVVAEGGYTNDDGIGVSTAILTAQKEEVIIDPRIVRKTDTWGSTVIIDHSDSDQGVVRMIYPDNQLF